MTKTPTSKERRNISKESARTNFEIIPSSVKHAFNQEVNVRNTVNESIGEPPADPAHIALCAYGGVYVLKAHYNNPHPARLTYSSHSLHSSHTVTREGPGVEAAAGGGGVPNSSTWQWGVE